MPTSTGVFLPLQRRSRVRQPPSLLMIWIANGQLQPSGESDANDRRRRIVKKQFSAIRRPNQHLEESMRWHLLHQPESLFMGSSPHHEETSRCPRKEAS